MHWALIAECLTCLKPFLQTWHEGIPSGNDQPQYWGALSNTTNDLSAAERSRNLGNLRAKKSTGDHNEDGELKLRSDLPFFLTKITSDRNETRIADTEDGSELLPGRSIRVRTTTTTITS